MGDTSPYINVTLQVPWGLALILTVAWVAYLVKSVM